MLGGEDAHRGQLVPGPVIPAQDRLGNHRAQAQINRAVVALERCHAALIHQLPAPSSLIHVQYRTIMSRSGRGRSSSGLRGVPKNRNPAIRSGAAPNASRSEEHTSELQSLMRISYAVFCLKKKTNDLTKHTSAP